MLFIQRFVVEGHNIAIHCDSGGLVHDFLNVAYVHFIIHWYAFDVRVSLYGKVCPMVFIACDHASYGSRTPVRELLHLL